MSFYRWIFFPLISGILTSLSLSICLFVVGFPLIKFSLLIGFIAGVVMGFILQLYNEYQTRKILTKVIESDFKIYQKKKLSLFCSYVEAFDLSLKFIKQELNAKIKQMNNLDGLIKAQTKLNWKTNGNFVTFKIKKNHRKNYRNLNLNRTLFPDIFCGLR